MKKILFFTVFCVALVFGGQQKSIYSVLEDATNSGITEGSSIPDEDRPKGFIIKHVKDEKISLDDDHDGILNEDDECPDTPEGKIVDENGCMKLIRLHVRFDFDRYSIKKEYKDEIEQAVSFLKDNPKLKTTIEGHTDSVGKHGYNQTLSEKRAKAVATVMVNEGVDKERMIVKGHGETIPVASNETDEGRALNRRVDISFDK